MMFLNFLKKFARIVVPKAVIVGIDVQDNRVALFASTGGSRGKNNSVSASEALPPGTIEGGEIKNPDAFFDVVAKMMQRVTIGHRGVEPLIVLSISPNHMFSELSIFPMMRHENLQEAIRLKMETSLPWPIEKSYVDRRIVPLGDPKKVGVFIVGIERRILDPFFEVFRRGGWRVSACEFHLLSLAHSMNISRGGEGVRLLIFIDDDCLEFGIFSGSELLAHANSKLDGRDDLKAKIGFEVRRLLAYAETETGSKIERILLFDKKGIESEIEELHKEVDIPTQFFSLPENPAFAVASGASAREFAYANQDINFVPPGSGGRYEEDLIVRTINFWVRATTVFLSVMLAASIGFYIFIIGESNPLSVETKQLKIALENQVTQSKESIDKVQVFNALATAASGAAKERRLVSRELAFLVKTAAQSRVSILEIQNSSDKKTFFMKVYAPTRTVLVNYKTRLETARRPAEGSAIIVEESTSSPAEVLPGDGPKYFTEVRIPILELAKEKDLTVSMQVDYVK